MISLDILSWNCFYLKVLAMSNLNIMSFFRKKLSEFIVETKEEMCLGEFIRVRIDS